MLKIPSLKIINNVFEEVFDRAISVKNPKAIFTAGQPGAGKGGVVDDLVLQEKGNIIVINTDDLRKFHPFYNDIMSKNVDDAYSQTIDFANVLADKIYKKAIKEKKNIIFDGTFGSAYKWQKENYIKVLKKNKYKIELAALSVNPIISTIGINYRPASLSFKDNSKNYRPVPLKVHNEIYNLISKNIKDSVKNKVFDKYYLYRRNNLKFGAIQVKSFSKFFANKFIKDFNTERNRNFTSDEKNNLNDFFKKTIGFIRDKNDVSSSKKVQAFKDDINKSISFFKKSKKMTNKKIKNIKR